MSKTSAAAVTNVPAITLYTGAAIPTIGLGTFGSDHASPRDLADAVRKAGRMGYRHFDCASVYGNEAEIGHALAELMRDGVARRSLWITSKVWNDCHDPESELRSCETSLRNLQLDYLDAYLVHWPFPNHHPPGCDVDTRMATARPYNHDQYLQTWRAMEDLVRRGLARHIGTSNMSIPKLKMLLRDAQIPPALNQMELHPHFQQPELFRFLQENDIVPVGFSPLGSPNRPSRDRTASDTSPMNDPVIQKIADAHDLQPPAICLMWGVQRGQVVIPFSTREANLRVNLDAVVTKLATAPLTVHEMEEIRRVDQNCRLIKGQVFLWRGAKSWRDLWDEDGTIRSEQ